MADKEKQANIKQEIKEKSQQDLDAIKNKQSALIREALLG